MHLKLENSLSPVINGTVRWQHMAKIVGIERAKARILNNFEIKPNKFLKKTNKNFRFRTIPHFPNVRVLQIHYLFQGELPDKFRRIGLCLRKYSWSRKMEHRECDSTNMESSRSSPLLSLHFLHRATTGRRSLSLSVLWTSLLSINMS